MKILFKKLKKVNKTFLIVWIFTILLYIVNYILLVKNIINLTGIETLIRCLILAIFGIWIFIYFLWNLVNLILKKYTTTGITTAVTFLFIILFWIVNYYVGIVNNGLDNLVEKEYVTYTTNLVTLKDTNINDNSTLAMINSSDDIEGNILAKELIKEKKLEKNEVKEYSSYYEMIYDLLNKKVDGIFLSSNYKTIFDNEDFKGLEETIVYFTYSKKMKNKDTTIISNKNLTEPFTLLLLGVDSTDNGIGAASAFNGDTLMMITFNPKTLNATMFSIPRDTYVPIACNNNRYAKINSAAAYGTNCVIDTITKLTGIDIDYYLKINFQGVVDLVNSLGGIDVDVAPSDYTPYIQAYKGQICEQNSHREWDEHTICINTGMQHLNGEEALAYARCRHAYLQSDIARGKHQQQIVEAIAKKIANPNNINRIEELLNAITNNLATNMSRNQILSSYSVIKNMLGKAISEGDLVSIQKTYLEWQGLQVRLSNNGSYTSAVKYYSDSLNAIIDLMKVNLGLKEKEMIKTFSFNAFENYQTKVTGEGIRTGTQLETLPNFRGQSISVAEDWCTKHNIILSKEFVTNDDEFYNPNVSAGVVANQSISEGILVNNISELTIYINEATIEPPLEPNEPEPARPTIDPDEPINDLLPTNDLKE